MIEKFYRRMIDGVPAAVIAADENLRVIFANKRFKELFLPQHRRGSLGEFFRCGEGKTCGSSQCARGCQLRAAFEDSVYERSEVQRRVLLKVKTNEGTRDVAFNINVKPLGDGIYMGVIDSAFEMEIARELASAQNIQQRLLPAGNWVAGHSYSYMYLPCRGIGGDLPDVYSLGNSAFGVIADVSGKGISAGMLSAFVKAAYDKREYSPAQAIRSLCVKFNELNLDERNYVTVAAVRIDGDSITYSMAGHNVPILFKTGGGITRITLNSPPVSNWFENPAFFEDTLPYSKGDILVLLTDGVTESRNPRGEMFGSERTIKTLSVSRTADEFIKNLQHNLRVFCGGEFDDDITAIAFDL
ncbi:MAG TPA: SpoIIE family protein phosphatase [Candidatus Coproplasma excrementigallinarum]|uniref:SpoIIE family protein phosphatase n=1 Tax=Candidatus Coproplasma excrementigallinarum TaxID=2840747 RepID=A0A9D1MJ63_9FIRM|nr:SpoIIE family protein phosphatase [Candidatus Coproplasma excrementigallinarum]